MRDIKYLLAYFLPASAVLALLERGPWAWSTVVLAFGILPLIELAMPASTANVEPAAEAERERRPWFDVLLYVNFPMLFGILGLYLWTISYLALSPAEWIGLTLSTGIVLGANGINVAHELGHRATRGEQLLAKWMLMPALYQHFFIEHNRGHHKYVATERDPATARFGESVYVFWLRSTANSWRHAWRLEAERLRDAGRPFWSLHNEMLRFQLWQLLYLAGCTIAFGPAGLLGAIAVGITGILLLETINYIEHYGLRRRLLPSGRPEPVTPAHSWNSDHELGRVFLYELTRHSDHHFKATRKYQVLRHLDESPQLPFGYPTCMVIAMVPPLWFALMNPRIGRIEAQV
jgi:alkane 1-monooxygenase